MGYNGPISYNSNHDTCKCITCGISESGYTQTESCSRRCPFMDLNFAYVKERDGAVVCVRERQRERARERETESEREERKRDLHMQAEREAKTRILSPKPSESSS